MIFFCYESLENMTVQSINILNMKTMTPDSFGLVARPKHYSTILMNINDIKVSKI